MFWCYREWCFASSRAGSQDKLFAPTGNWDWDWDWDWVLSGMFLPPSLPGLARDDNPEPETQHVLELIYISDVLLSTWSPGKMGKISAVRTSLLSLFTITKQLVLLRWKGWLDAKLRLTLNYDPTLFSWRLSDLQNIEDKM